MNRYIKESLLSFIHAKAQCKALADWFYCADNRRRDREFNDNDLTDARR